MSDMRIQRVEHNHWAVINVHNQRLSIHVTEGDAQRWMHAREEENKRKKMQEQRRTEEHAEDERRRRRDEEESRNARRRVEQESYSTPVIPTYEPAPAPQTDNSFDPGGGSSGGGGASSDW